MDSSNRASGRSRYAIAGVVLALGSLVAVAACQPNPPSPTTTTTSPSTTAPGLSNVLYINLQSGREDLHRVNMAFQMARGQRSLGRPVTMFFNINAPELATVDFPTALRWRDKAPIKDQLAELIGMGVKVLVCPSCSADQGVTADQLVPGANMASPALNAAELQPGTVTMSY